MNPGDEKKSPKRALAGLLLLTALTVNNALECVHLVGREWASMFWPTTTGVVLSWDEGEWSDDDYHRFSPNPVYVYAVDGQAYKGGSVFPSEDG